VKLKTENAFAELGLAPSATEIEIKAAWRRLVSQWHPDRNDHTGAVARMQRINDAFRVIRRSGFAAASGDAKHAAPRSEESPDAHAADPQRRSVSRKIKLTLEEAAAGCTKVLQGQVTDSCSTCAGLGYRLPGGPCPQCEGSGEVRQAAWFGWAQARVPCEGCGGSGESKLACPDCHGTGKLAPRRYKITVRTPLGVRDGDLLHVDGRRTRSSQVHVDLHLRVDVLEHAFFELEPDGTIRCDMPVDGFAWIANRSINVPTLDGPQPLQLDRDRLSYRLKHQGFPVERRGPRGDQLVTVRPMFPERLSTDQDILLDQLIAASSGADGQATDERLRAWNQAMTAWHKDRVKRDTVHR
jgi:molecular chaperone DnaJ